MAREVEGAAEPETGRIGRVRNAEIARQGKRSGSTLGSSGVKLLAPLPLLALAVPLAACGLTGRHALGPTVDTDGRVGILYTAGVGPMVRCDRKLAVPIHAGLGAKTAGLDDSHFSYELGAGVDWMAAVATHSENLPMAPSVAGALPTALPSRLGYRLGLRSAYLRHGDARAITLGAAGALTYPLPRRYMSLGAEAACDALALRISDDAPIARCRLSLVLDLTNPHAFQSDTYY